MEKRQDIRPVPLKGTGAPRPRRMVPERLHVHMIYLGVLVGLLFGSLPFQVLYLVAANGQFDSYSLLLLSTLLSILCMAMPVMAWASHSPAARSALKLHRRPSGMQYALTLLLAPCLVLVANALTYWWVALLDSAGFHFSSVGLLPDARTLPELFLMLLMAALTPALVEEMLFRGVMLESYLPLGRGNAVFLSTLLFALMHGTLEALPAHILAGFALGFIVLQTDSLRVGILLHFLYNALLLCMDYVARMVPVENSLLRLLLQDDWLRLWPLALAALAALISCLAGFARTKVSIPRLRVRRESGAVWLPMILGLILCVSIYVNTAFSNLLPGLLEALR